MKLVIIINVPPYGTERGYNARRLAHSVLKKDANTEISVFLTADAIVAARKGQKTPELQYGTHAEAGGGCQGQRPALPWMCAV